MTKWIEWNGRENPVPGKIVDVRLQRGVQYESVMSDEWCWDEFRSIYKISHYRVVEKEEKSMENQMESSGYKHSDFTKIVDSTIAEMRKLIELKGGEYAGDVDRLANFRRNGERLGIPMEVIWGVYAGKHIDAVFQYIQDIQTGKKRERIEPITGRVDDIIVYMLLFKALIDERERNGN